MSSSAISNRTRAGYMYDDCGSLTAATNNPSAPYSAVMESHKSVVKVAIPHCRGRWFPTTATRIGSERPGARCKEDAGLLRNARGDDSRRTVVFGCGFIKMFGADIAGS